MSSVSSKIREFGLSKYSTLTDFAQALGISYHYLYQYIKEDNPSLPGTPFLLELRKLGCDMNWLLSDDEKMDTYQEFLLKEIRQLIQERDKLRKENKKIVNAVRNSLSDYFKKNQ